MLDASILKSGLSLLFTGSHYPTTARAALKSWTDAYRRYLQGGTAAGCFPSVAEAPPVYPDIDFFSALSQSLSTCLSSTIWTGPSLNGVIIVAPPVSQLIIPQQNALMVGNERNALDLIVGLLSTYTKSLIVTVTNVSSGVTFPANIV